MPCGVVLSGHNPFGISFNNRSLHNEFCRVVGSNTPLELRPCEFTKASSSCTAINIESGIVDLAPGGNKNNECVHVHRLRSVNQRAYVTGSCRDNTEQSRAKQDIAKQSGICFQNLATTFPKEQQASNVQRKPTHPSTADRIRKR